jgi:hypothetical protein
MWSKYGSKFLYEKSRYEGGGMISSTELLVIGIIIVYTSIILIGLYSYESKIKSLSKRIDTTYSQQHYTELQLEVPSLRKSLYELDRDNDLLKKQLAQVRLELLESRPLEFESSKIHDQNNGSL